MPHRTADVSTANPEQGSLELTEELIRVRAYQFYEERGCEDGHELDDWLRARAEILGKISSDSEAAHEVAAMSAAAA